MKIVNLTMNDDDTVDIELDLTEEEEQYYNTLSKETGKPLDELISVDEISKLLIEQYKQIKENENEHSIWYSTTTNRKNNIIN